MKQFTAWRVEQHPGGVLEWTSPTGRSYREEAPAPAVAVVPLGHPIRHLARFGPPDLDDPPDPSACADPPDRLAEPRSLQSIASSAPVYLVEHFEHEAAPF